MNADKISDDPQTYSIIGAAMAVHSELGRGFLENVYQDALMEEFRQSDIPFQREVELEIRYRDVVLNSKYRADFICYNQIIVETKALEKFGGLEHSQIINYLKATGLKRGLLLNFGSEKLDYKRVVLNY